jgi:hypothetical protein
MKEAAMNKARLIKRDEVIQREQTVKAEPPRPKSINETVKSVREMMITTGRRATGKLDPRAAFAALFAQPQTN